MEKKKTSKRVRVWSIATAIILVLVVVLNVVCTSVLAPVFNSIGLGARPILASGEENGAVYAADYETKTQAREAGNALTERICEEGFVLLKNEGALPIATPQSTVPASSKPQVSVFGKNSLNLVYAGTGSGAGTQLDTKTIVDSLTEAGYEVNPELIKFYQDEAKSGKGRTDPTSIDNGLTVFATGETAYDKYPQSVIDSYASYSDAAFVVFTRRAGEGNDLAKSMVGASGARDPEDHFLQLDANETELLHQVCEAGFSHVIVIINSANVMELGFLDDPNHYAYDSRIDGAVWVGTPGSSGIMALGRILNGTVNPSGKLTDTYPRNLKADPTWNNFGTNVYSGTGNTTYGFVDYEEGIYSGYRYWETRGFVENQKSGAIQDEWYHKNVVYPFGYGLSYTTFEQVIANKSELQSKPLTADGTVTVKVAVTNTGTVPGKSVVELYVNPPYYEGQIEKSHALLVDFAKTDILEPGKSETVELTITPYWLASYDYSDANGNGFSGYELDAGSYCFYIGETIHTPYAEQQFEMNVAEEGIRYATDPVTGTKVENLFDDADAQLVQKLSRTDFEGTWPQERTTQERTASDELLKLLTDLTPNNPLAETYTTRPVQSEVYDEPVVLKDMVGKSYDDADWEKLLNEMSVGEMLTLFNTSCYMSPAISSIDKPMTLDTDGPVGMCCFLPGMDSYYFGTCTYASEVVLASTWNRELAYEMGEAVGNEALVGSAENGGMPYSGWYAPGMNLHRSAFCGRNYEYCSEDPILTAQIAAGIVSGAKSKGVYTYAKHFAVNEQETNRNGLSTWVDEQTMREVYLRQFEMLVKSGVTNGIMSSFNRIGTRWTGGDYRLLTQVLRNEWGFEGCVISDFNSGDFMNPKQMAYAGGSLNLNNQSWYNWNLQPKEATAADITILRQCAKDFLYLGNL